MSIEELKILQNKVIKKSKKIAFIFKCIIIPIIIIQLLYVITTAIKFKFFMFPILFMIIAELIVGFILFSIVRAIVLGDDINVFNKNFKEIFILSALRQIFDDLSYDPYKGVSEEEIEKTGLIYLEDRFSSNDYIFGTYKNINFEQCDVHIEEKIETKDKDGNISESYRTTFLGRWMNFDFNKYFRTNVIVSNSNIYKTGNFKKITMENDDFNKKFSVFAENEHDAFYILTPHFMERIDNLSQNINGSITLGFINNKLYVALDNNEDAFEYNVFEFIDEKK